MPRRGCPGSAVCSGFGLRQAISSRSARAARLTWHVPDHPASLGAQPDPRRRSDSRGAGRQPAPAPGTAPAPNAASTPSPSQPTPSNRRCNNPMTPSSPASPAESERRLQREPESRGLPGGQAEPLVRGAWLSPSAGVRVTVTACPDEIDPAEAVPVPSSGRTPARSAAGPAANPLPTATGWCAPFPARKRPRPIAVPAATTKSARACRIWSSGPRTRPAASRTAGIGTGRAGRHGHGGGRTGAGERKPLPRKSFLTPGSVSSDRVPVDAGVGAVALRPAAGEVDERAAAFRRGAAAETVQAGRGQVLGRRD